MHRALSERQVLASLTTNPARFFKAAKKGRVEQGFDADLVVLDGDPLSDVGNLGESEHHHPRRSCDLSEALRCGRDGRVSQASVAACRGHLNAGRSVTKYGVMTRSSILALRLAVEHERDERAFRANHCAGWLDQ